MKSEVKFLSIRKCCISPVCIEVIQKYPSHLKYLDISMFNGSDRFVSNLVAKSKSLESINMSQCNHKLVSKCLTKIRKQNCLTTIDLCCMNQQFSNRLKFASAKKLVKKCRQLTDVSFCTTGKYFCLK